MLHLASQIADDFSEEIRANVATWLVLLPFTMAQAKRNVHNAGVSTEKLIDIKEH